MNAPAKPLQIRTDILTYSGNYFNLLNPHLNEFDIEDIAHALSNVCRFAGHTREFYSVAQHSLLVSRLASRAAHHTNVLEVGRAGLLHDATEAYIGDVTKPLKQLLPDYMLRERRIEEALFAYFKIPYPLPDLVKLADTVLLATEQRDLMPPHDDEWHIIQGITPMPETINPWPPAKAEREFLLQWEQFGGVM